MSFLGPKKFDLVCGTSATLYATKWPHTKDGQDYLEQYAIRLSN